jgi:hypothetical protein
MRLTEHGVNEAWTEAEQLGTELPVAWQGRLPGKTLPRALHSRGGVMQWLEENNPVGNRTLDGEH